MLVLASLGSLFDIWEVFVSTALGLAAEIVAGRITVFCDITDGFSSIDDENGKFCKPNNKFQLVSFL